MNEIFISYRQDDAKGSATLVHETLVRAFGSPRVFLDKDSLGAGNWQNQIHDALNRCKVFVVVIGKRWLEIANPEGVPRLHLPDDTHAEEIAVALARSSVLVIPLRLEGALELFGGLLDYCLCLEEDNAKHGICPLGAKEQTSVYSGYLWKCVAPRRYLEDKRLTLRDVWFVWEHTNFASPDAVSYNLDSLERKEEYIRREYGDLVLVQKSCSIVPGTPQWRAEEVYELLLNKKPLPI